MEPATCVIDGFGPLPLIRPNSVAELGDLVRRAAVQGQALYPLGGRTALDLGNPPTTPGLAVDLCGLDQVIDFPARDMTVTVQAGITVARLQALLAPENLRLPIDVPQPEQATLGGILATNVSGPRRYGYGTLRDYVIGISAVNDEGAEFKAGGRVVKNVAGYDLCKLLVGSLGTLGIITQATLKLRPLAEESALITLGCEGAALSKLLEQLHASRTRPVCVELMNPAAAQGSPLAPRVDRQLAERVDDTRWTVMVGYEGNADAVNWQVQQLVMELGAGYSMDARVGAAAEPLWQALVGGTAGLGPAMSLKANGRPHAVADFAVSADRLAPRTRVHAHAGNGIVWGHVGGATREQATALLGAWREAARTMDGAVIVRRCPADWKAALDVWGPPPADAWLMRRVKEKFDPRRMFNPGRFVDGI